MEAISIFDIFKIGVGPSSSHTLGPWKAALDFTRIIDSLSFTSIKIQLFGSLSKTGRGHGTDRAVQLGLMGYDPKVIPCKDIDGILQSVIDSNSIVICNRTISFNPSSDIIFTNQDDVLHPNTLKFEVYADDVLQYSIKYASVGGGFIERKNANITSEEKVKIPYPVNRGIDILKYTDDKDISISSLSRLNELSLRSEWDINKELDDIIDIMLDCAFQGCTTSGILPGGLEVKRRAQTICAELAGGVQYENRDEWLKAIGKSGRDFNSINKWISCFALAVNEVNAAMGRIVTSPTNGAAGVIPAVLLYFQLFCNYKNRSELRDFLFTAGEIGCLFKKGATISAAVGGCQAEIGVSSAMAAAGLTEVLGGSPRQCLMAAEIAMEHHLGLTCDPIGGLVQIPCIERNAMGAMKAITASNLALSSDPHHAKVDIDTVIKTMWDTAQDMNAKYKETSEGGLAFNLPILMPNC